MKTKLILLLVIISITLSACSSGNKIDIISKNLINEDLSDDISINKCLYNEESNAVYVKFYSFKHGTDEAIILLDDNSIFYSSVYSTIKEYDYVEPLMTKVTGVLDIFNEIHDLLPSYQLWQRESTIM